MMNVTPEDRGHGYRIEMPDGRYAYLSNAEATALFRNLRSALRPPPPVVASAWGSTPRANARVCPDWCTARVCPDECTARDPHHVSECRK